MKVGISVECDLCKRTKAPHGRSVPIPRAGSFCDDGCPGYTAVPLPGCLWPGETEEEFGFTICHHATKDKS